MEHSILFGNGINRLTKSNVDWKTLLEGISAPNPLINNIPNTLQYENIYLGKDIAAVKKTVSYKDTTEYKLKEKIAMSFQNYKANELYNELVDLKVRHFMTTNYDHTLDLALESKGYDMDKNLCDSSEDIYNIRRRRGYKNDDEVIVWPIHGDMDSPRSIMLGYDQYCSQTAKYNAFLKGQYKYEGNEVGSMVSRFSNKDSFTKHSWIDCFFVTTVHIVGLGLKYEELDLWWLLNKRARMIKEKKIDITNTIHFYESDIDPNKKKLLENFLVVVHEYPKPNDDDYFGVYRNMVTDIRDAIINL